MDQLGSGLFLAIQDLEIRGAGEILGEEQSGEIQKIGYELYNKLLRKTINSLKRNSSNRINDINDNIVEIKMNESSLLPENYCPCLLYTSPSPRDATLSRMPSSA